MAHINARLPQALKLEDARDLQIKLYREIGISAVAAALRFTTQPDTPKQPVQARSIPAILQGDDLAA